MLQGVSASSVAMLSNLRIEPQGWDDPDFKLVKKNDDGTNIWGDPELHKQVKVQKWMHVTRHMPNTQAIKQQLQQPAVVNQNGANLVTPNATQSGESNAPVVSASIDSFSQQIQQLSIANAAVSSPTSNAPNSQFSQQPSKQQQQQQQQQTSLSATSQWSNTPAAPAFVDSLLNVIINKLFLFLILIYVNDLKIERCLTTASNKRVDSGSCGHKIVVFI